MDGMRHEFGSHVGVGDMYVVQCIGGDPAPAGCVMLARDHDTHVLFDNIVVREGGQWSADLAARAIDVSTDGGMTWAGPICSVRAAAATDAQA